MKQLATLFFAVILSACAIMQPLESPHVTLVDLRILDMTLFEQSYSLKLRVQNPNPVALPITGINFRLDLNDAELGRGVGAQPVTVPAYGEAVVEIKVVSSLARIMDQIHGLESGKARSLRYRLAGDLRVANHMGKLPFDYQGEIGQRR